MVFRSKKYSVLLLYPDKGNASTGPETYFAHVEAASPDRAAKTAQGRADWDNKGSPAADDFKVLAVFAGHVEMELGVLDFVIS